MALSDREIGMMIFMIVMLTLMTLMLLVAFLEGVSMKDMMMMGYGEKAEDLKFPGTLTFRWRVIHNILFTTGGVLFLVGSICLIPGLDDFSLAGWCFTIGSGGIMLGDTAEWFKSRVGCIPETPYSKDFEERFTKDMAPKNTMEGFYQRAEAGINCFLGVVASGLFLWGSADFIPMTGMQNVGAWLFIVGCLIFMIAKIMRIDSTMKTTDKRRKYENDPYMFWIDIYILVGASLFLIGSPMAFDYYSFTGKKEMCAIFFIAGSCFFVASGNAMTMRYFYTENIQYVDELVDERYVQMETA